MVSTVRVFRKTSPNGKVTAYLSRRDFVDHISHTSPVDGVVVVDHDYLRGRRVFARVAVTFRHGREEDEVMGLHFSKEFELVNVEVVAGGKDVSPEVDLLKQKLGPGARPFCLSLPGPAPASVTLDPGQQGTAKMLGVTYELVVYVGEAPEQRPSLRNSVVFPIRKVQRPPPSTPRRPRLIVAKTFTLSPGKLTMEIDLDRDLYYHGQVVEAHISVSNASKKTVKYVVLQVLQHVELTITNTFFSRVVASVENHEGCPVTPDSRYSRTVHLTPMPLNTLGVALEGHVKDQDVCLASSTMSGAHGSDNDALGIIVSYSLRVKLNCGAIGGELTADLPFKLMHADPDVEGRAADQKAISVDDDILIEEFRSVRRGRSLIDELDD